MSEDRRRRLGAGLDADALLVTKGVNVRYLTGFTGSNAALLLHRDGRAVLATDGRYRIQAEAEAPDVTLHVTRALLVELAGRAAADGVRHLAVERHHLTVDQHDRLTAAAPDLELVDGGGAVERLRVVKDDGEMAALARACTVTDAVFADLLDRMRPGVTERDVAWAMLERVRAHGGDGPAFDAIVAFGPHSAIPHHQPTDRPLARGDLVKLDFGARVDGYHADMTRTVVCGPAADWQRDLHATVHDIQRQTADAVRIGALPVELDTLARSLVAAAGHEMPHGLGHGVGLEIHESPFAVPESAAATLADRVPLTVEPGIYLTGRGGVRIEDTVVVGPDGATSLTTSPRELIEI